MSRGAQGPRRRPCGGRPTARARLTPGMPRARRTRDAAASTAARRNHWPGVSHPTRCSDPTRRSAPPDRLRPPGGSQRPRPRCGPTTVAGLVRRTSQRWQPNRRRPRVGGGRIVPALRELAPPSVMKEASCSAARTRSPLTRTRRPPARDRLPGGSCIGGEAAAPPPLSSSMRGSTAPPRPTQQRGDGCTRAPRQLLCREASLSPCAPGRGPQRQSRWRGPPAARLPRPSARLDRAPFRIEARAALPEAGEKAAAAVADTYAFSHGRLSIPGLARCGVVSALCPLFVRVCRGPKRRAVRMMGALSWTPGGSTSSNPFTVSLRRRRSRWVIGTTLVVMSVATPVAQASFPGRNGNLALALELEQCNSQIAIIRADGSDRKWLTAAPCREEGRTESATEPAWSPDGRELLFHASSDVFGSGVGRLAIVSADSSARSEIPLNLEPLKVPRSVDPDGVAADLASSPSFSPDGSHVVYTRRVRSGEEIWRAKLDGSDHRRLAIGSGPHWSPRGERIAYDRPGIWLMRARDGE